MGMTRVKDDFETTMKQMLDKSRAPQAGFARIYAVYQRLQTERFKSENASQGARWQSLNPEYAEYKKKRYGGGAKRSGGSWKTFPGNGNKMMVATGTLAGAVIGPGAPFQGTDKHRAMFTTNSMSVEVVEGGPNADGKPFEYASKANEVRPVMEFSEASLEEMKEELAKFVFGF